MDLELEVFTRGLNQTAVFEAQFQPGTRVLLLHPVFIGSWKLLLEYWFVDRQFIDVETFERVEGSLKLGIAKSP